MTHNGAMSIYKQPAFAFWHLALRMLRRDLKAGELRLLLMALALAVAVAVAVAALPAVAFFSSRLDAALRPGCCWPGWQAGGACATSCVSL